jgi:hypothetical protein
MEPLNGITYQVLRKNIYGDIVVIVKKLDTCSSEIF